MKSSPQSRVTYKSVNKRAIALALLICFISVSLLSGAFILTRANHEHDHDGTGGSCTVCVQIQNAESFLRVIGTAALCVFTLLAKHCNAALVRVIRTCITALTPITAKTRINN